MKTCKILKIATAAVLVVFFLFGPGRLRTEPGLSLGPAVAAASHNENTPSTQLLIGKPDSPFKVNVIPPSPEVSALAKYVEIPVSLYTGTPEISIPLFEIRERDLTFPIALTYHSSGHKVEDEAPRTGLGWSLRAGGVIARSIRGLPDEYFGPGGFLNQAAEMGNVGAYALGTNEQQFLWYENMAGGCRDAEPDVFYFDFAGYSGKFQFDWDGSPVIDSADNLTITPRGLNTHNDSFIEGWQVNTPDGLRYIFDIQEKASTRYSNNDVVLNDPCTAIVNLKRPPQSWHLREILSNASTSKIIFEYDDYFQTSQRWSLETIIHNESLSPASPSKEKMTSLIEGKYLRAITTSSGETTIELIPGDERTDVEGTGLHTLGALRIMDRRGTEIRNWDFAYDYRTGRLTLISLQEAAGSELKPPYRFEYESGTLPNPLSLSRDHWGFYNNNTSTLTMVPAMLAFRSDGTAVQLPGADRAPAIAKAKVGMLRKITYPTGGSDTLSFEPHDYSFEQSSPLEVEETEHQRISAFAPHADTDVGEVYEQTIPFTLSDQTDLELTAIFTYGCRFACTSFKSEFIVENSNGDELRYFSPGGVADQDGNPTQKVINETLVNVPPGQYRFTVRGKVPPASLGGRNSVSASMEWDEGTGEIITLTKQGGGVRIAKITRSAGFGNPDQVTLYDYTLQHGNEEISSGSLLESGEAYAMWTTYVHAEGNVNVPVNKFVRFSQNRTALGTTHGSHVGYKQVAVSEGQNAENGHSVYRYTSPIDHPDVVDFQVPFAPALSRDYQRGLVVEQSDYVVGTSTPVRTITHNYDFNEQRIPALKVGWNQPSDGGAVISGPAFLDRYALGSYTNVLGYVRLIETRERLLFPITFQLGLHFQDELKLGIISFALRRVFAASGFPLSQIGGTVNVIDEHTWRITDLGKSYLIVRDGDVLKVHTESANIHEKTMSYEYDEDGHKQLIKETTIDSEGVELVSEYKYPGDYPTGTSNALDWMLANYELNSVVEQVTYRRAGSKLVNVISARKNDFGTFPSRARLAQVSSARIEAPLPTSDPFQAVQNRYEPRLIFQRYDPYGNILEHSPPGGIITSYLWDQDAGLPLAAVEGARTNQIFYTSFEQAGEGSRAEAYTGSQSLLVSGIFTIPQARLPRASGDYWLSYWRKVGDGPWRREERLLSGYRPGEAIATPPINGYLDEVRLHPVDARMMTFTYKPLVGLTSTTDFNGISTTYEYDPLSRLVATRDHHGNIIRSHNYVIRNTPDNPNGLNFVRTYAPRIDGVKTQTQILALLSTRGDWVMQSTDYFDGAARLVQQVTRRGSPMSRDIVDTFSYDPFGRQVVQNLPFTLNESNGEYKDLDPANHPRDLFYQANDDAVANTSMPFAFTRYDGSPLNRVLEQGGPGEPWQPDALEPHVVRLEYHTNTDKDKVLLWKPDEDNLTAVQSYAPGSLGATATIDENHHSKWVFKDKLDRPIMEMEVGERGKTLQTYFVYDERGNLTYVLPPSLLNAEPSSIPVESLAREAYHYVYDERNRVVEKHMPGVEPVLLIYDPWDRPVLSQDGEQRPKNRWSFTKYDIFDRAILGGEIVLAGDRSQVQEEVSNFYTGADAGSLLRYESAGPFHGYTNRSYPILAGGGQVYSVTYFDDYSFLADFPTPMAYKFKSELGLQAPLKRALGQQTASKLRILGTPNFVYTATYYDDRYNPIQTIRRNHDRSLDRITQAYDFVGNLTQELSAHGQDGVLTTLHKELIYDPSGRLGQVYHQINNDEKVLLYRLKYNELDEVIAKDLYSTDEGETFAQSVDYRYNIRGWLSSINNASLRVEADTNDDSNDLFGLELFYDETTGSLGNTAEYNGNISAVRWKNARFNEEQSYVYAYDAFDRLVRARYRNTTHPERRGAYDEKGIQYDANGNLASLERYRWQDMQVTQIDGLIYTYAGNQLRQVTDSSGRTQGFRDSGTAGDDFDYDANGNQVRDLNKRLTVTYNHLNLPERIVNKDGEAIQYVYDANGMRRAKTVTGNLAAVTDYAGDFVYENGALRYIRHEEGIVTPNVNGTGWTYQYYLKDQLGNVRLTFAMQPDQEKPVIVQADDYYPFGLPMGGRHFQDPDTNRIDHLYNGKELQDELQLNWFDYGARMYDPALGRWHVSDALAESYYSHSPYAYTLNNPVRYIDLDGDVPGAPAFGKAAEKALGRAIRWASGQGKNVTAHVSRHIRFLPGRAIHSVFKSPNTARKLVIQGLKSPGRLLKPQNKLGYYVIETEFDREIGRAGERILRIVFKRTGKIVTAYPIRNWQIGAGVFLLVDQHAVAAVDRADQAVRNIKEANDQPWYVDVAGFLLGESSANEGEDEALAYERIFEEERNLLIEEVLESGQCSSPELCFPEIIEAYENAIIGTDLPKE